jgi:hypothetical protein
MSPREEEEAKEVSVSLHLNLALAYQFVIMDYCKRQKNHFREGNINSTHRIDYVSSRVM